MKIQNNYTSAPCVSMISSRLFFIGPNDSSKSGKLYNNTNKIHYS